MSRFFSRTSVRATLRKQKLTGKVTSGTLRLRTAGGADTFTDVTWANLYVWPQTEVTGFEGKGYSDIDGMVTLYRVGETSAPRADDQLVIASKTYLIKHVTPRLNADETSNFAVYDAVVTS